MPEEEEPGRWIVEPPGPGEVTLHMAAGEGADLTDAQKAAVGELLRVLEERDPEVTGHALDETCKGKSCKPVKCDGLVCKGLKVGVVAAGTEPWNLMGTFIRRRRRRGRNPCCR